MGTLLDPLSHTKGRDNKSKGNTVSSRFAVHKCIDLRTLFNYEQHFITTTVFITCANVE